MDVRDVVRRVVVQTNPYWPFSAANRMPYRLAIAAVARRMRRLAGVRALHVRNGLTRPDWVPGISDIDLTLVTEAVPDARRDYALLCSIHAEFVALKRTFPMLGELDVLSAPTVAAWSRFGIAGYETRFWQPVFGELPAGLGFRPSPLRHRFDAWNHAQVFGLDLLQRRVFAGDGMSFLSARELRRIAAKVLAYAALARGESRDASPLPPGALPPAGIAALALRHLDAAARTLDLADLWADSPVSAVTAAGGAEARLHGEGESALRVDLPRSASGIDAVVDADALRIVVLRDGLGLPEMQACFEGLATAGAAPERTVKVVTPAVLARLMQASEPHLHAQLIEHGRVVHGPGLTLPPAAHERSRAHAVLAQAQNAISTARSRELVAPHAAAFVGGRLFALAVERALFIRTLLASGTVSPWYHEIVAESRRRYGDVLARAAAIAARTGDDDAGFAAFLLLRELADDVAADVERANVEAFLFRRAG